MSYYEVLCLLLHNGQTKFPALLLYQRLMFAHLERALHGKDDQQAYREGYEVRHDNFTGINQHKGIALRIFGKIFVVAVVFLNGSSRERYHDGQSQT